MAAINDLIDRIENPELRERLREETARLLKQKKFGLVFEEHIPEATPLYDVPIKRGGLVAARSGKIETIYRVLKVEGEKLLCERLDETHEQLTFPKKDMVAIAQFGEPIYPYLKPIDSVCNAPDSDLWHTLIEADNYHALQLLVYLYGGKVDCIYIDPPYNTRATDWKYNNDYVDPGDSYCHSKWLSMMKKRLLLAKKLLNPNDSVLIVTIDEKEYLHLGCLLEDIFPENEGTKEDNYRGRCKIQMVSTVINVKGASRKDSFARSGEYIFFIMIGKSAPSVLPLKNEWLGNIKSTTRDKLRLADMMRHGSDGTRKHSPNLFYPIFVSEDGKRFMGVGNVLKKEESRFDVVPPKGAVAVFPIHSDGTEGRWGYSRDSLLKLQKKGYLKLGGFTKNGMGISFIQPGWQKRIEDGQVKILGYGEDGFVMTDSSDYKLELIPADLWSIPLHNATEYGMKLLNKFFPDKRFDYPKSLYAVHDAIRFFVANKQNALIVDFFAGSGTTLHAVNLLNAEDNGLRRCILVTNNELSGEEANELLAKGFKPGDEEWVARGIARYVTWPRTKCSILGVDVNNKQIKGNYITTKTKEVKKKRLIKQLSIVVPEGKGSANIKQQIVGLLGGKLAQTLATNDCNYIISEKYPASILFNDKYIDEWIAKLNGMDNIEELYVVTQDKKLFNRIKPKINKVLSEITEEKDVSMPMSEGFKANAQYFKLGFLDKREVALDRQFRELLPLLWMKAGSVGACPKLDKGTIPAMLILPENKMAVLVDESHYAEFEKRMRGAAVDTVFIITDSEIGFNSMASAFKGKQTYQLYRDYLENFSINH